MTRRLARIALVLVGVPQAEIAAWGLISPHGFFTGFPGSGHHWVSVLGQYNEHLVRDYAAAELGFAVLLFGAAIWFRRETVLLAGSAFLAATIPHLAYHLTTTGSLSTADNLESLGAFVLELLLVAFAMVAVTRPNGLERPDHGGSLSANGESRAPQSV
ncbi:MAG: hypothetical protein JOZ73_04865 [Solirubrobacterales bacterium]|nr:hypothetical protein [Solirubrobacterales bacterium]